MNLRIRITFGFLIIVFVMTCVAGMIIWQESKMYESFQQSLHIGEIDKYFLECRRQEKNYFIRHDRESIELFRQNHTALTNKVDETIKLGFSNKSLRMVVALQNRIKTYDEKFIKMTEPGYSPDDIYIAREVELAREIHTLINELNDIAIDNFNKAHRATLTVNIFSILIGFFLAVLIAGFISTKIMEFLGNANE